MEQTGANLTCILMGRLFTGKNSSMLRLRPIRLLLPAALLLALAACGQAPGQELIPITIQTFWLPDAETSPFYAAERGGYWEDEGLDAEIRIGGYDEAGEYIDPIPLVVGGEADFGMTTSDQLVAARSAGAEIVALSTVYQRHATGLMSLARTGIIHPADLEGKRVMIWGGDTSYDIFLQKTGVDASTITMLTADDFGEWSFEPLLNGEVDATIGYINFDYVQLQGQATEETRFMLFADYGVNLYPNAIFTTEDMIRQRPDVVQRFVNAYLRGLNDCVNDPEGVAAYIVDNYRDQMDQTVTDVTAEIMLRSLPLIDPADSDPGRMTAETWEYTYESVVALGWIETPLDPTFVYDLSFVDNFYAGQTP